MRPGLQQSVEDAQAYGQVIIFYTNNWNEDRQTGGHWGGDLPTEEAQNTFDRTKAVLQPEGWDFSPDRTKILMLTHRLLANQQGYNSLPATFQYNESFTKKENPHTPFFVDQLEPACDAFIARK